MSLLWLIVFAAVLVFVHQRMSRSDGRLAKLEATLEAMQADLDRRGARRGRRARPRGTRRPLAPSMATGPQPEALPPTSVPAVATSAPTRTQPATVPGLEEQLGTRWAVWVGGVALALGGVLLVRYSIEQGWFGPGMRVALGSLFALALLAAGEWFRQSERRSPIAAIPTAHIPSVLTAAGTLSAFATVWAAHALYDFIGPAVTFTLLGVIGVGTMLAAAIHGPALAGLGLAGAFATPALLTSTEPQPWPVVLYLAVVAAAAFGLARLRTWLWLAATTVAGAVLWGLAFIDAPTIGTENWAHATYAHVALQLALAAVFMAPAAAPDGSDEAAAPDWIATVALAALAGLAVAALARTDFHAAGWVPFSLIAAGILVAAAYHSAPTAGAAPLGGSVALAAVALWPGLAAPPESRLLWPAAADILRLPEQVTGFLGFAALAALGVAAAATLRLWRGRRLPVATAALYALAAIATPLLALILVYLRVTQFDRSIPFASLSVALAALLYVTVARFDAIRSDSATPATHLAVGAFAAGVAAAVALALTMALDRGYLTVAFALTALTTALFAVANRIPLLRAVVVALGLIVLSRIAWDPRIMGADVGSTVILNWLLIGYGVPAAAFLAAGHILRRERDDLAARISDALGVVFVWLLVFFEVRHALNGGDVFAPSSGHVEQGLLALMSVGLAYVLTRLDLARGNPVFLIASLVFSALALLFAALGLGLAENPLFTNEPVRGAPVLSSLLIAYLLPGLAAVLLARATRGVRPDWYVTTASILAVLLVFGYVTLEVRHVFQGERIGFLLPTSNAEVWAYSVAWLLLGLVFLGYGIVRASTEARLASAAVIVLTVVKVFLYDLAGSAGLWRALSFICLGLVLVGIGLVYQKLVFARPAPRPQPAAPT